MIDHQRSEEYEIPDKFPRGSLEVGRIHVYSHLQFLSCGLFDGIFPSRLSSEAIQSSLGVSSTNGILYCRFLVVD